MYGTVFRMKVRQGQQARVAELFEAWSREIGPKVDGSVAGYVMQPDNAPDEMIGVAVFRDEASYRANAESPDQNAWYGKLRDLLAEDPEWEDGEYVAGGEHLR